MKNKAKLFVRILKHLNYNTIVLNFTYFSFWNALKFPILINCPFLIKKAGGKITTKGRIHTGMLIFGYNDIGHFDNAKIRSIWEVEGEIILDRFAGFANGVKIIVDKEAKFNIGYDLRVGPMCSFIVFKELTFGEKCLVGWESQFMDTDFHHIVNECNEKTNFPKPITIGNNVWITSRITCLKGSQIPDGSIVGSGSVVAGKFSETHSFYGGNPCTLLKSGNVNWHI